MSYARKKNLTSDYFSQILSEFIKLQKEGESKILQSLIELAEKCKPGYGAVIRKKGIPKFIIAGTKVYPLFIQSGVNDFIKIIHSPYIDTMQFLFLYEQCPEVIR